jgi:hypothetical protein
MVRIIQIMSTVTLYRRSCHKRRAAIVMILATTCSRASTHLFMEEGMNLDTFSYYWLSHPR